MLARLPKNLAPVLELARSAYVGERKDDWSKSKEEVDRFVQHAVAAIEALL